MHSPTQGVALGYGQQLGLQPATINYPCGARINGCGRSAWKALRSEATITGNAVPGGTMRRRCAFPGTSYPVIVASLRTASRQIASKTPRSRKHNYHVTYTLLSVHVKCHLLTEQFFPFSLIIFLFSLIFFTIC